MTQTSKSQVVRNLPAVDKLLNEPRLKELEGQVPRSLILQAARKTLDDLRARILEGSTPLPDELAISRIANQAAELAIRLAQSSMRNAINATGVILHTGLGRAVLPEAACQAVGSIACGHSTLEISLETGARESRSAHFSKLLADICGAEAALAVNNTAGAVFLALNALACGTEVIVSRGQLVEIGGSFRLPDIMARAGARLVEVGTTNRTRLSDYEAAISDDTALILRVHPSNYRIVGFTEEVPLGELVGLGRQYGIPVMDDVGSGALIDMARFGLRGETMVQDSVKAGADIITFSGDKLMGGPQAGLIVGREEILDKLASNPLARILRIDKLTVAALEATLRLYNDPESITETIPTLRFIARSLEDITRSGGKLKRLVSSAVNGKAEVKLVDGVSEVGGGSLPGESLPTKLVAISAPTINPTKTAQAFRMADPPIFGRVGEDMFLLDVRTVSDSELTAIARAAKRIFNI